MSFQQGLSGLNGSAKSLDVIGHNIANASTVGFKSSQAQFADVYATSLYGVGGLQVGIGVKVADVAQSFSQGNISATGNSLDLAITGEGFFQVNSGGTAAGSTITGGVTSYTRSGQFHLDNLGYLVDNSLARVQGYAATNGVLGTTPGSAIQVTFTTGQPLKTSNVEMAVNLDADESATNYVAGTPPSSSGYNHTTSVTVYDSLGSEHTLSFYFSKNGGATVPVAAAGEVNWNVHAFLDGAAATIDGAAVDTMIFPVSRGRLTVPAAVPVVSGNVLVGGVSTTLTINADMEGSTMFAGKFGVNTLNQDGYGKGELAGLEVTKDGIIQAQYTNGQALTIGQLSLTSFINPNGLSAIGDNHWIATPEAGTANTQQPNSGILGLIQSGAVEESNVDLTGELVNMIVAQRMYQANAQTIKTQDQILQTLVNLR